MGFFKSKGESSPKEEKPNNISSNYPDQSRGCTIEGKHSDPKMPPGWEVEH